MVRVTGALMCLPCPLQDNPKQRAAAQQINGWSDNPENVDISAVSVLDDDGASGVGAAAAAAVSVALARSWASAASQKQVITQQETTAGARGQGLAAVSASRSALVPLQCWQHRQSHWQPCQQKPALRQVPGVVADSQFSCHRFR